MPQLSEKKIAFEETVQEEVEQFDKVFGRFYRIGFDLLSCLAAFLVEHFTPIKTETFGNIQLPLYFSGHPLSNHIAFHFRRIYLFHNGGQIKYSFVLLLISLSSLATASKF